MDRFKKGDILVCKSNPYNSVGIVFDHFAGYDCDNRAVFKSKDGYYEYFNDYIKKGSIKATK
jgi:hypothetical protein